MTYSAGSGGGIRVVAPLKSMVTDMGMFTVPATVKIDSVHKKFDESGKSPSIVYFLCVFRYDTARVFVMVLHSFIYC